MNKQNINSKETDKKQNEKKENFFKKLLKSVKNFEKYEEFGLEGIGKTAIYLTQIVAIFTIVISTMTVYNFSKTADNAIKYFDENIDELIYSENGELQINSDQKVEIKPEIIFEKIVIDTSDLTEEEIENYRNEIQQEKNSIVLLKNKALIKNEMVSSITETNYSNLLAQYDMNHLDKQEILDYYNNNQVKIYLVLFITVYIYMFIIYLASILVDSIILGALGFVTSRIAGMRIRFGATFSMGVHALTLPIILNMVYIVINGLTGFTIKNFQFMYTAISYIYVITAIFIIRSDYIKKQQEVEKIKSEQERIRQEIEEKNKKEEDEAAERKAKDEKQKQKQKEKDNENHKENDKDKEKNKEKKNNKERQTNLGVKPNAGEVSNIKEEPKKGNI